MTWTPPQGSSTAGQGLSDEQRAELATLERVQQPTSWQRGRLDGLRFCAGTADRDSGRVEALRSKWAAIPRADR